MGMRWVGLTLMLLGLAACAAPRVLKAPPRGPSMVRSDTANPIPAYAIPDPKPHEGPQGQAAPSP